MSNETWGLSRRRLLQAALAPLGTSGVVPVGLELDALPGSDRDLPGLGIAVERVIGRIPPPSF